MSGLSSYMAVAFCLTSVAQAGQLFVNQQTGSDSYDGKSATVVSSSSGPFKTFETAVSAAEKNDEVIIAPGNYVLQSSPTCAVSGVTFRGTGATAADTIIDGQCQYRCLYAADQVKTAVMNLTFRKGYMCSTAKKYGNWVNCGAGVYLGPTSGNQANGNDCSCLVSNCVFDSCSNLTRSGGALFVSGATRIVDCVFTNCLTQAEVAAEAGINGGRGIGGALLVLNPASGDTEVRSCLFVDNRSTKGPACIASGTYAFCASTTNRPGIVLRGCTFLRNETTDRGGAVRAKVREAYDCHFVSNSADIAQAAFSGTELNRTNANAAQLPFTNLLERCKFIGNSTKGTCAAYSPGAYAWTVLSNCTFKGNRAAAYPVIYQGQLASISGTTPPSLGCCILDSSVCENSVEREHQADKKGVGITWSSKDTKFVVDRSLFMSNSAAGWATALDVGANSEISRCRFIGNRVLEENRFGGAVFFEGPNGKIVDSLFWGNTNISQWGCCVNACNDNKAGRGVRIWNCTFVRNAYKVLYGAHGSELTEDMMVGCETCNCVFWENASNFQTPLEYFNLSNCYASDKGMPDRGNIQGTTPKFLAPDEGNFMPGPGSPLKNNGTNAVWMVATTDLADNPRIDSRSGRVDIGCYEAIPKGLMLIVR